MSVEYCLLRVPPPALQQLRQHPHTLHDLMDAFYAAAPEQRHAAGYVDSRDAYRSERESAPPALRLLYLDEFTTSLLVNFMDERSAFFAAIAGWGIARPLPGVTYGYGPIAFYSPEEAQTIATRLQDDAQVLLEARFAEQADAFRIAAAGYLATDQAIRAHQRTFADLLRRLYTEAARDREAVLLLVL